MWALHYFAECAYSFAFTELKYTVTRSIIPAARTFLSIDIVFSASGFISMAIVPTLVVFLLLQRSDKQNLQKVTY
jgi:hypothetical protein